MDVSLDLKTIVYTEEVNIFFHNDTKKIEILANFKNDHFSGFVIFVLNEYLQNKINVVLEFKEENESYKKVIFPVDSEEAECLLNLLLDTVIDERDFNDFHYLSTINFKDLEFKIDEENNLLLANLTDEVVLNFSLYCVEEFLKGEDMQLNIKLLKKTFSGFECICKVPKNRFMNIADTIQDFLEKSPKYKLKFLATQKKLFK